MASVKSIFARKPGRHSEELSSRLFDLFNYSVLLLLGLVTLGPFIYLIAGSFTQTDYYRTVGVTLNPAHWSLDTYRVLLGSDSRVYRSLQVSFIVTVAGTTLSLILTSAMSFGLSRKDVPGRNLLVMLVFFTILFSGGMVPFYLVVKGLGMINKIWSLFLPLSVNAWYMFIMMQFFSSLPSELMDAAKIDGCSEITIFTRIALPLSGPVLATIGLFYAVGHWNEWFWASVFITKPDLMPMQLALRGILSQMLQVTDPDAAIQQAKMMAQLPSVEVLRMGAIVIAVLPVAVIYPFLQRYFVKGILVGSIKG